VRLGPVTVGPENAGMDEFWTLRRVLPSDAPQVAAHACFREADAGRRVAYAEWVKPRIGSGRYLGVFAMDKDAVIAGAGAVLLDWGPTRANPNGQMARVANVFTAETHRRQGVARSLMAQLLQQCEALGVREFNLATTPDGRALYQALGFEDYPAEMRRRVPWP
jgi:GNAT superfamily N-acetyltransferase